MKNLDQRAQEEEIEEVECELCRMANVSPMVSERTLGADRKYHHALYANITEHKDGKELSYVYKRAIMTVKCSHVHHVWIESAHAYLPDSDPCVSEVLYQDRMIAALKDGIRRLKKERDELLNDNRMIAKSIATLL